MLEWMLAIAGFDLIVAIVWVGGLTLLLLGRALISWHRFRRTSDLLVESRRLSEATQAMVAPRTAGRTAHVIPLRTRSPSPAAPKSKII
jgi:hypothetical protein